MKKIVLVGNPNTGKTTLFNSLTKASEHTGNWHGVTVDSKEKAFKFNNSEFKLIDLPGIYSLSPQSFEEKVTSDYLYTNDDFMIINIVDVNNIYRNFYLTLELLNLNRPMILVINKTCKTSDEIYKINEKKLQEVLGIPVIKVNADKCEEVKKLQELIYNLNDKNNIKINQNILKNNKKIEKILENLDKNINFSKNNINIDKNFILKKLLEDDEFLTNKLNISNEQKQVLLKFQSEVSVEEIVKSNYENIDYIFNESNIKKKNKTYGKSKIDKFVLNKYLCIPFFLLTLFFVFYITFFGVGAQMSKSVSFFIQNIFGEWLIKLVSGATNNLIIIDFFKNAIIGGVGSIFSFLPQVVILFMCLGVLEDSGYLSRVAFSLDDIFSKLGLSGKSVYVLLMGFGCSGVATLSSRVMDNKNAKIKTAIITPYISCSAKLPIYTVLGSAFFGANNIFIIFSMYVLGVIIALLLSIFYEKTFLKSSGGTFILEFPAYRKIKFKRLLFIAKENAKQFILRIGTVLISVNIIVWVLSNFSFAFTYVGNYGGESILQVLGKIISPIFIPLGFGSWGPTSALFAGLIAKEIIVSSIAMFNGVKGENLYEGVAGTITNPNSAVCFTPASAVSYMVFCLLYSPCVATLGVLKKEVGKKWLLISMLVQFVVSYLVSLFVYNAVNIILNKGIIFLLFFVILLSLLIYAGLIISKFFSKKHKCGLCKGCKK